ncbi:MAG: outer membrane beta-barrel protein [Bacteroidetes bacterium]|nr:outer membrane beta-barrel protein [Bacteroidota bacterium]
MKRKHNILLILCILIMVSISFSNAQDYTYSLEAKGSYTTSSKVFLHPEAADLFLRGKYLMLENIYGVGIDIRRKVDNSYLRIGFSIEYLEKTENYPATKTQDAFLAIPVELTGFFYIPITGKSFDIYMGAGVGLYFGERRYTFYNVKAKVVEKKAGAGIHVQSGVDYNFYERFALRTQVKFRDLQFQSTNQFTNPGDRQLDLKPFTSQINIDGMTLELGLVYYF